MCWVPVVIGEGGELRFVHENAVDVPQAMYCFWLIYPELGELCPG